MTDKHVAQEILSHLEKNAVGILGTLDKDSKYIRLRVMYYGIDSKFNCYLMSMQDSPKIKQLLFSPSFQYCQD